MGPTIPILIKASIYYLSLMFMWRLGHAGRLRQPRTVLLWFGALGFNGLSGVLRTRVQTRTVPPSKSANITYIEYKGIPSIKICHTVLAGETVILLQTAPKLTHAKALDDTTGHHLVIQVVALTSALTSRLLNPGPKS